MAKSADEPAGLRAEPYSSHFFFDNPSLGRALRYTFAEKRLGRAVFMNALLLVVALGVVQDLFTRGGFGLISEKLSFGKAAFLTIAVVETVVVSLLGPLSFAHLFNAERREDCFDQVVASGCSPLRILLGRYAAVLGFLGVVAGSALPFFILASVVLRGADLEDVLAFYAVLGLYGVSITAMTMATCVAVEDAAFPIVLSGIFTLVAIVSGFSPHAPPAGAAWSPFRHILVELAPVTRQIGYGDLLAPALYGHVLPTAPVSCAFYAILALLAIAYTCVGPDLELSEGLDSFASVTLKRGAEASRGRRGLAATLLRTVQLRFFYENLGPRLRALGPMLRLGSTAALFVIGHAFTLGTLWPRIAPRSFGDLKEHTTNPYLGFTALTIGLIALASSGSRAAVLARVPVLSLGSVKISRFPALFLLLGIALALPPVLFWWACRHQGIDPAGEDSERALAMYGLIVLYAVFMFSVGLVTAMVTTNPYSAMGSALAVLFFANLLPLGWIPLFTSNVVTEESSRVLDVSPIFAAWAVMEPDDGFTLTTIRDEQTIQYEHKPSWRPFVWLHAPIAAVLLAIGLALERRDARTRKFLSALGVAFVLLIPGTARAQGPSSWRVELDVGLGGKTAGEGFTPVAARLSNDGERDATVTVSVREPGTGALLARLGPVFVPRGQEKRVAGIAPADPIAQAASNLAVEVADETGILATATAKADVLRGGRLLVVLDKDGALPFALPSGGLRFSDSVAVRSGNKAAGPAVWSVSYLPRASDLPTTPQGWTGAGAVFVHDLELDAWAPSQAKALAGWLARGGDLFLSVGERAELLRDEKRCALGAALAGELDGLPAVPPRTGVDLGRDEPAAFVAVLEPTERDRVVERDPGGKPLVLQRTCGAGRLTLLAYDPWKPPFRHEDSTRALFERFLSWGPRYAPRSEQIFPELSQLHVQPARIGPAFGILLLYACLIGPGVYFALRPRKKGLLAWVLIPAFTAVFALAMPLYRLVLARSESAMVTASIVETSAGDSWEDETVDALVFSGGLEHHELSLRGEDATAAVLLPPKGFRAGPPRPGASLALESGRAGLDVPLWGARYVSMERLVRQPQPRFARSRVALSRLGVQIELANEGPLVLEDVAVLYPDFHGGVKVVYHELASPLARGADVRVAASRHPAGQWGQGGSPQKDLAQTLVRRLVAERLVRRIEEQRDPYEAVLVGHAPDAAPSINATPQVRVRAQAEVVVARLPFVFVDHVPFGACAVRREIAPVASGGPASELVRIELPSNAGSGQAPRALKLEVSSLVIALDRVGIEWRDAAGAWKPVPLEGAPREDHGRKATVELPPAALDSEGAITLRQTADGGAPNAGSFAELDLMAEF